MKILSFDIESTTGSHKDGSMCTFGYCISDEKFNIIEQKDIVMKPKTKRFETKIKLHYEKSYIKAQPEFTYFYEEINNLIKSSDLIIGFSIMNDVEFLNNACELYSLKKYEYSFIDVQLLYKTIYKKPNMVGLETLSNELEIPYEAHRSDEDARLTLLVFKHLVEKENLTFKELFKKYNITAGITDSNGVEPCTNGVLTKREKNFLLLDFAEKNFVHNYKYKGGLSYKIFGFSDDIRYQDIDLFRRVLKKIISLNGRTNSFENCNVYVTNKELNEKEQEFKNERNKVKEKLKVITFNELLNMLGELPEMDFSSDVELLKEHRIEVKKARDLKRKEQRKKRLEQLAMEKIEEGVKE